MSLKKFFCHGHFFFSGYLPNNYNISVSLLLCLLLTIIDATEEDRARPRILLLSFSQAAGHNLQEACKNVILYDPVYSGTDAVADASVEEQAVGRVMRQGQKYDVTVFRIILKDPEGKRCLDDWITERNLDENVLRAATSNF